MRRQRPLRARLARGVCGLVGSGALAWLFLAYFRPDHMLALLGVLDLCAG
jgi:hypothetical protein